MFASKVIAPEGLLDQPTFEQIAEIDDEDHEFSKAITHHYFEQAETTFLKMENALSKNDLPTLSRLGHFLKGSSAALGLQRVKVSCEKMQHYGDLKAENGTRDITKAEALRDIADLIQMIKKEYKEAEAFLKMYFGVETEE